MRPPTARRPNRRGVTLLEMLVVVALVVLMMLILASIFQAATGAMSAMRTYQELDDNLRLLDQTLRNDLLGTTAKMTPPNNPLWKSGYFEYGENAPADAQGEDTDDYLAFTTKAPEGRVFTGRFWVPNPNIGVPGLSNNTTPLANNAAIMPVTISSQYAEVIYFLRNGNLYRRVLLIAPERQGRVSISSIAVAGRFIPNEYQPQIFGNNVNPAGTVQVGWYGVNDLSARPNDGPDSLPTRLPTDQVPIPNDLGDLTNRENRFARQRFMKDYFDSIGSRGWGFRDGVIDDTNNDLLPDFYPTLTSTQVLAAYNGNATTAGGSPTLINIFRGGGATMPVLSPGGTPIISNDVYSFPFIYPGMYSKPETASLDGASSAGPGWLHALDVNTTNGVPVATGSIFNHAPVEIGDSLPVPSAASQLQTWFGFPTFRETASVQWRDPIYSPATGAPAFSIPSTPSSAVGQQVRGLQSFATGSVPSPISLNLMPPLGSQPPLGLPSAPATPFGSDGAGYSGPQYEPFVTLTTGITVSQATTAEQLSYVWDDDLIMTGVRSFDVKAYDGNATLYSNGTFATPLIYGADYYDLGYASSDYTRSGAAATFGMGTPTSIPNGTPNPTILTDNAYGNNVGNPRGFGHEGRMPPLTADNRVDPQRPYISAGAGGNVYPVPNNSGINFNNIGDNSSGLNRLRRVWDSWSTDYTQAPAVDVNMMGAQINAPNDRPVYPSYPPPYPEPLRGIQIQIRVADPRNEKVKVLTIRQDFTDKL